MAVELFENQEDAEERFRQACIKAFMPSRPVKKKKVKVVWRRQPKQFCHICGKDMSLPGEYLAVDGIKFCCVDCHETLPICGQCGKGGPRQYCRECIRAR